MNNQRIKFGFGESKSKSGMLLLVLDQKKKGGGVEDGGELWRDEERN